METQEYRTGRPLSFLAERPLVVVVVVFVLGSVVFRWWTIIESVRLLSGGQAILLLAALSLCLGGLSLFFTRDMHPRRVRWLVVATVVVWAVIDQLIGAVLRDWIGMTALALEELSAALCGALLASAKWEWLRCVLVWRDYGKGERARRRFRRYVLHRALRDRRHIATYIRQIARRIAWSWAGFLAFLTILCLYLVYWAPEDMMWPGMTTSLPWYVVGMVMMMIIMPIIAVFTNINLLVQHAAAEYAESRPCFACGASCVDATFDSEGIAQCAGCEGRIHRGQWIAPPLLSIELRKQLISRRMFVWLPIMLAAQGVAGFSIVLLPWYANIVFLWLFGSQFIAIGLCLYGFRRNYLTAIAKRFDRQHIECRECAYNLSGAPIDRGVGTCPECSTQFAKYGAHDPHTGTKQVTVASAAVADAKS